MTEQAPMTKRPVDPEALQLAIREHFRKHRGQPPYLEVEVDEPTLNDGAWRSLVHLKRQGVEPKDYSALLADVEEDLVDDFGVNVVLVPAID